MYIYYIFMYIYIQYIHISIYMLYMVKIIFIGKLKSTKYIKRQEKIFATCSVYVGLIFLIS